MSTINISLPSSLYKEAKNTVSKMHYASMSELIRDALRRILYSEVSSEEYFSKDFEDKVLRRSKEPYDSDIVFETEEDLRNYFSNLKLPAKRNKA
jgi:Arc/MetJ-type ribon-helix-helix transcriptional regulator